MGQSLEIVFNFDAVDSNHVSVRWLRDHGNYMLQYLKYQGFSSAVAGVTKFSDKTQSLELGRIQEMAKPMLPIEKTVIASPYETQFPEKDRGTDIWGVLASVSSSFSATIN